MEKYVIDEKTGIHYMLQGDYYLPVVVLPAEKKRQIGIWGQRHLRYIKTHRRVLYLNLLTSGLLNGYLAEIDERAENMFFRLVKQYADRQGVTETLKAENPLEWAGRMENIRACAKEVVEDEVVYA